MNIHNNARLTAWGRAELVRRVVLDGEPVHAVAAALRISASTAYKWLGRFAAGGWAALADRSSRPHHSPTATKPKLVERILRLRAKRLTGPEIAEQLRLPVSTVGRISPLLHFLMKREQHPYSGVAGLAPRSHRGRT